MTRTRDLKPQSDRGSQGLVLVGIALVALLVVAMFWITPRDDAGPAKSGRCETSPVEGLGGLERAGQTLGPRPDRGEPLDAPTPPCAADAATRALAVHVPALAPGEHPTLRWFALDGRELASVRVAEPEQDVALRSDDSTARDEITFVVVEDLARYIPTVRVRADDTRVVVPDGSDVPGVSILCRIQLDEDTPVAGARVVVRQREPTTDRRPVSSRLTLDEQLDLSPQLVGVSDEHGECRFTGCPRSTYEAVAWAAAPLAAFASIRALADDASVRLTLAPTFIVTATLSERETRRRIAPRTGGFFAQAQFSTTPNPTEVPRHVGLSWGFPTRAGMCFLLPARPNEATGFGYMRLILTSHGFAPWEQEFALSPGQQSMTCDVLLDPGYDVVVEFRSPQGATYPDEVSSRVDPQIAEVAEVGAPPRLGIDVRHDDGVLRFTAGGRVRSVVVTFAPLGVYERWSATATSLDLSSRRFAVDFPGCGTISVKPPTVGVTSPARVTVEPAGGDSHRGEFEVPIVAGQIALPIVAAGRRRVFVEHGDWSGAREVVVVEGELVELDFGR